MKTLQCLFATALLAVAMPAMADQPAMEAALRNLQQARADLLAATPDKGGHRVKALRAVDEAIEQVRKGMAYDRNHLSRDERRN
jgi:hypothetical protein